jgi:RND family efflux transporter MFP subunit
MVKMKKYWPIALASIAVGAAIGYGMWTQRFVGRFAAEEEIRVKVAAAKKIKSPGVIETVGQLQAGRETDVISLLPGVLKDVRVKIGDAVKTGEVVALLQATELIERGRMNEIAVKAAAADLQDVRSQLENTEKKLAMTRDAYRKDLIARRDMEEMEMLADTAQAEKERAQARLAQGEAALAQTRYLLSLTRIVAPVTGVVTGRIAEPGASVAASAVIMSVADPAIMRVVIKLPAAEARLVHPGGGVTVRVPALPGKVFDGSVSHIKMAVEGEGNTSTAEIELRNTDGALKPAMEALISMPLDEERELIMIPYAAVFELQEKHCVYVIEDQRARLRSVTTGAQKSGDIVVTTNLAEGEKVAVTGQSKLRTGSYVRIVE